MSERQKPNETDAVDNRPMWQAPVIDQDSIADSTRAYFAAGIDRYESSNPVGYGS